MASLRVWLPSVVAALTSAVMGWTVASNGNAPGTTAAHVRFAHPASLSNPSTIPGWERVQVNRACEICHAEIAAEWRTSRHHIAYTNLPYQKSVEREHPTVQPFCQSCHAPEANPLSPPTPLVGELGVGCVTCHAPQGPVLASSEKGTSTPHAVLRTQAFASEQACANCHEFLFPSKVGISGLPMQRTVTELGNSPNGETCQHCHMPLTVGEKPHRDHTFVGGYNELMVKNALRVTAERVRPSTIRVTLTPNGVAHAVPTGDLFRRIAVELKSGADGERGSQVVYLARHFDRRGGMKEVDDNRVLGEPRVVDLRSNGGPATVEIRYERVANHMSANEQDATVESSFVIATLTVDVAP